MSDNNWTDRPRKTIWVFKTSVTTRMDIRRVAPALDSLMQNDDKWNFDLEDCDHILRVETKSLQAASIIFQLKNVGYACEELEDDYVEKPLIDDSELEIKFAHLGTGL